MAAPDYSKYITKPMPTDLNRSADIALRGLNQLGKSFEYNRSQGEAERQAQVDEEMARQQHDLDKRTQSDLNYNKEQQRQLHMDLQQRGFENKEARDAAERKEQKYKAVDKLQAEHHSLMQSPDPRAQGRLKTIELQLMMLGAPMQGEAPVPMHMPESGGAGIPLENIDDIIGPQEPMHMPESGLPAPVSETAPSPAAAELPPPAEWGGVGGGGIQAAMFAASQQPNRGGPVEPGAPAAQPAPYLGGGVSGIQAAPQLAPPPAVDAPPPAPTILYTNPRTGELYAAAEFISPEERVHPVDDMIAATMAMEHISLQQKSLLVSAYEQVKMAIPYNDDISIQDWQKKALEMMDTMMDNETNLRNSIRPVGGGDKQKRIGYMTEADVGMGRRLQRQGQDKKLMRLGFYKSRNAIDESESIIRDLVSANSSSVGSAVARLAGSVQTGVLSNQDKAPFEKLLGVHGTVQKWWAANIKGEHPEQLVKQLVAATRSMQEAAKIKVGRAYDSMESEYIRMNRDLAEYMMGGPEMEAEANLTRVQRDEQEKIIRDNFNESFWQDLPGVGDPYGGAKKGKKGKNGTSLGQLIEVSD